MNNAEAPVLETVSSSTDFEELVDAVICIAEKCAENRKEKDEFRAREKTFSQYFRENLDLIVELRSKFPPPGSCKKIEIKGKLMNWSEFCDEYFGVSTQWVAEQVRGVKYIKDKAAEDEWLFNTLLESQPSSEIPVGATTVDLDLPVGDSGDDWTPEELNAPIEIEPPVRLAREELERADHDLMPLHPDAPPGFVPRPCHYTAKVELPIDADNKPIDKTKGFGRFQHGKVVMANNGGPAEGNRGNGMAVDRLRDQAKKLGVPATVTFANDYSGFILRIPNLSERGAREILKFIGEDK
jgi:hypothetical protein